MAKKVIQAQMQQRRDTAAQWAASNPVLLEGELGIVTDDPNLYKIGDGVTAWNDLKLRGFDGTLVQTTGDSENAVMSQKAVTAKLTELESIVLNKAISNVDGITLVDYPGRMSIIRYFPISAEPHIFTNNNYLIARRYYDSEQRYIGVDYSENAKYIRVVVEVDGRNIPEAEIFQKDIEGDRIFIDNVVYRLTKGLPLGEEFVKGLRISIDDINAKAEVRPNLFFQGTGYIDLEFANINEENNTCSITIKSDGVLLNVENNLFLSTNRENFNNKIIANAPYRYGMIYGKFDKQESVFQSLEVGAMGWWGEPLNKDSGFDYVPLIAWDKENIIYRIPNENRLKHIEETCSNAVLKNEMANFEYVEPKEPFELGAYWYGANGQIPYIETEFGSSTRACFKQAFLKKGDIVSVKTIAGELSSLMPIIRMVNDEDVVVSSILTDGEHTIPSEVVKFYVSVRTDESINGGEVLTEDNTKQSAILINGEIYPLKGVVGGYQIPFKEDVIENDYYLDLVSCFERIVCIGDSITAGFTGSDFVGQNIGSNDARVTARNWTNYFKKATGVDVINLGYGSTATTHWRNSTPETESSNLGCALELANIEGTQAYFVMLGWNDTITNGNKLDIAADYNNNADSFYGNYDNIIRRLHEMKPNAHIFVFTLARAKANSSYNDAIRYISSLYEYCHCIDYSKNKFFDTNFFNKVADGTHYSPLGYNAFGHLVKSLVSSYIYENPSLFKGIPYTSDSNVKGSIDVQDLRLTSVNLSIDKIGSYQTICAKILPNSAANKKVKWDIVGGDETCLQLIENQSTIYCTIKGLKSGYAVIRATSDEGGHSATCLVSVASEVINVSDIALDKSSLSMNLNDSEKSVIATILPSNATNQNIRWSLMSGGDSVATIESTDNVCLITPRGKGSDTLVARTEDGNKEARCSITIL